MHPDLQEILHNITTRLAKLEKKQEAPTMTAYENTDKEIWRKIEGEYYSPRIFVTKEGSIGISVGGHVYVQSVEEWHKQSDRIAELEKQLELHKNAHHKCVEIMQEKHGIK